MKPTTQTAPEAAANPSYADASGPVPRKRKVLAVDDEQEILRLYETFLGFGDYEVTGVDNADEALRHLKTETADILLLDVNMPGIDGLKLLEFIRGHDRLHDMRVIMITAKRDEATVKRAVALGCDGFIVKPFKLADLERRIALEMVSINDEDIRGFIRGGLTARATVFRDPGLSHYNVLHWDSYVLQHQGVDICLLVQRGTRPTSLVKAPVAELEKYVVVLYKHPRKWKKAWPLASRRSAS